MEAKDLRINNWIIIDGVLVRVRGVYSFTNGSFKNNEGRVDAYRYDSIFEPKEISAGINHFEPIPLTEEWFVEFGAKLKKVAGMDNEYNLKLGEVEISWDKKTGVTVFVLDTLESFRVSYIKYVHQFQNFCFALTNEELTIKQYETK